jgi:hypothetical protein
MVSSLILFTAVVASAAAEQTTLIAASAPEYQYVSPV